MVVVAIVSMRYLSAAVSAQAGGLGKEEKEKRKEKKREERESMSDQERTSEPEPTESGPEVMQRRAEELRAMALQKQLAAASGAADTTNPSDEMDVEEEGEK